MTFWRFRGSVFQSSHIFGRPAGTLEFFPETSSIFQGKQERSHQAFDLAGDFSTWVHVIWRARAPGKHWHTPWAFKQEFLGSGVFTANNLNYFYIVPPGAPDIRLLDWAADRETLNLDGSHAISFDSCENLLKACQDRCPDVVSTPPDPQNTPKI